VVVAYVPEQRDFSQAGIFVQDQWTVLPDHLTASAGFKAEYNDFTGWESLPSVRLAWTPTERQTVWTAVSRAIRIPSRGDFDLMQTSVSPAGTSLTAPNTALDPESLVASELGYRVKPHPKVSFDVTGFMHWYDALYTTQTTFTPPSTSTSTRQNDGFGEAYGVELAAVWQPLEWWRLQLSYTHLELQLHREAGSNDGGFEAAEGSSPQHQVSLRSSWNLGQRWEFDAWLRHVDGLKAQARTVDSYATLDLRLAWRPDEHWEISAVGQNLLEESHEEFVFLRSRWALPRGFYGRITVRF
jgi:iron complex outermembrane receptor protein